MAEQTADAGFDAWILAAHPNGTRGGSTVRLQTAARKGVVQIPMSGLRGRTVLSATLTGHVKGTFNSQTLTVKLLSSGIQPDTVTWNTVPGTVSGVSGTLAAAAHTDGETVVIPITTLIQQVANGTKAHGFLLTTDQATADRGNFYSFGSGKPAWLLTVELSDAPEKPTNCRPAGGLAVGAARPVLAWSYTDLGADSSEQGAFQVQADPAANGASPAFASGTVTSGDPQLDLTTTSFSALASGASTQWRVRTQDLDGNWSAWSDWHAFAYVPYPTAVMDSPTGGVIGDPTPDILAHLTGETLRQYRVRVTRGSDRTDVLYDSGLRPPDGTTVGLQLPWRDPRDKRRIIHHDDSSYQINVRQWGATPRAEAVGLPSYVELWTTVTFSVGANAAPSAYTVAPLTPGDPRMVHSWYRNDSADVWLIMHGTKIVHRLEPADVDVSAGTYTFTDQGNTQPYVSTAYTVRAIDAGSRSPASNTVNYTSRVEGFWVIPEDVTIAPFLFDGPGVDTFVKKDRRASFQPINVPTNVDYVYGFEGSSGSFEGQFDIDNPTTSNIADALDRIDAVRKAVTDRPRLVWGTTSIRAQLSDFYAEPASDMLPENMNHTVRLTFIEEPD